MNALFANRVLKQDSSAIEEIFKNSADPANISFAGGFPAADQFPQRGLQKAYSDAIEQNGPTIFQYQTTLGPLPLRELLAERMRTHADVPATAAEIMLTQGGQQAIDLVAKLVLNPGDALVVEGPTYMGALAAFDTYEPTYYEVPVEDDGMDVRQLRKTLMQHPEIKLIYTVPDFHNPTGTTMSVAKRQELVKLANEYDCLILEDSPYRDLRYSGESVPAIKHFDTEGRVIFVSSFSKILSPALRTGWVVAAPEILAALANLKSAVDVQSSNVTLQAVTTFLKENDIDAHIADINAEYQVKRGAMLAAMDRYFPADVHYTRPAGGFFIWVTLPAGVDAEQLLNNQVLPNAHVAYVPSSCQYASHQVKNGFRLNFTSLEPATITRGIQQLANYLSPVSVAKID